MWGICRCDPGNAVCFTTRRVCVDLVCSDSHPPYECAGRHWNIIDTTHSLRASFQVMSRMRMFFKIYAMHPRTLSWNPLDLRSCFIAAFDSGKMFKMGDLLEDS